jgi:putative YhbY family RNA-binding protein
MIEITPAQRRTLRATAHSLHPVVSISQKGLTDSVLKEIDRCLTAHGLIKIRIYDSERDRREGYLSEICTTLAAAPVQHIGHLLVIWREKPVEAAAETPAPRRRPVPRLTKKAAVVKTDKAARARKLVKGKPRRPTRT